MGGLICREALDGLCRRALFRPPSHGRRAGQPDVRSVCRARALECIAADVPIVLERPVAPTMTEAESVVRAAEAGIAAAQEAKYCQIVSSVQKETPVIRGTTTLIAHLGYPTEAFMAPMIYNPYFEQAGIDAVVMPMGVKAEDYPGVLASLFKLTNIRGALVTMPHKVTTTSLVDEVTLTARIAGACNAILRRPDGSLLGDMFDGTGFVRGIARKGFGLAGRRALVVGCGGVGSAIAASLAAAGIAAIGLFDIHAASAEGLGSRLRSHYPALAVTTGSNDPTNFDLVVNATPMGMNEGDPIPIDVSRIAASTFVGEVVMKQEMTAFLRAAQARGCRFQVGTDMLFEQIPAYLEFFGFPSTTPDVLRSVAKLRY